MPGVYDGNAELVKAGVEETVQLKAYRDLIIDVVRSTFNDRIKQLEANHNGLTASLQFKKREVDDLKKTSTEKVEEISRMKKEMEVIKKKLNY
ncbi:hypothetical protein Pmani_021108 [Petrolisthes manimaculis]|uniref:Uncharacterized protein n=1 Tax=Petrolisthes manimaculis TaxID=1843537 RepID=A0AAE1PG92_9EUCA|nr:hypothetical protein Pmani_021108 [Petrolisthes manimaculis]